jgi:prepilin-type N-terminal cleavage/methylation domain-containing protein
MNSRRSRESGFTLVEILVVAGIIGLAAVIAVPSFVRANVVSQKNACINNLYQIRCAVHQWAMETRTPSGSPVHFTDIRVYLRNSVTCPAGGTSFADSYTITDTTTQPVCQKVPSGVNGHVLPPDMIQ